MRLEWLELQGFRSYDRLELRPAPGINVLVGPNGVGKTNVLEAIAYTARLKSFRRMPDAALVAHGADAAVIRAGYVRHDLEVRVEIELPMAGRRRILYNGKRPRRHSDLISELPIVAFLPDDLDVIKRGPGLRREFVDDLDAQLSPTAGADQAEYEKTIRQRNSLLRNEAPHVDPVTLDVWDERVAVTGAAVAWHRLRLLERLEPVVNDAYRRLAGHEDDVAAAYESRWLDAPTADLSQDSLADLLREVMVERRRRDLDQRTTTAGPHRDDPTFSLVGDHRRDARTHASQGEQRSLALAMRIAAYELLLDRHGHPPLLLLDDVFSELDPTRASAVAGLLPNGQVFVTTARHDEVPGGEARWNVTPGRVTRVE